MKCLTCGKPTISERTIFCDSICSAEFLEKTAGVRQPIAYIVKEPKSKTRKNCKTPGIAWGAKGKAKLKQMPLYVKKCEQCKLAFTSEFKYQRDCNQCREAYS